MTVFELVNIGLSITGTFASLISLLILVRGYVLIPKSNMEQFEKVTPKLAAGLRNGFNKN